MLSFDYHPDERVCYPETESRRIVTIEAQVQALQALIDNLAKAGPLREKIRLADRIYAALGECERLVDKFISDTVGGGEKAAAKSTAEPAEDSRSNGQSRAEKADAPSLAPASGYKDPGPRQFRGMKLADVGRALLKDRGVLHGSEIERLAKAGGFKSTAKSFQPYLSVAFKREGGFQNIGKNRWKLNESIPAEGRNGEQDRSPARPPQVNGSARSGGLSQKMKLHEWMKQNGPAVVGEAAKGAGLPSGTVSSYFSVQKNLFEKRDGKWYAR
jgi:hypothetical protein